jgi:hypothetical protein
MTTAQQEVIREEIGQHGSSIVGGCDSPDIPSILAAAEVREKLAFYERLLGFLRTTELVADLDADGDFHYTPRSEAAQKFMSDNQEEE